MIERVENPGQENINIAKTFGALLKKQFEKDPHFYLFSPDETTSNRLTEVYDAEKRAWNLGVEDFDLPEAENGRIVELLSENALFAALLGHLSGGEQGMMTSYEAFFSIILSQIFQQIKFYKQMDTVSWRKPWPAVNLLSTSMCWRQDHNGFTHQSPAIISALLDLPSKKVNCLFPVDDSAAEAAFDFMLRSTNVVNLTTFDKNKRPRYSQLDRFNEGAVIHNEYSDKNPDFVIAACGDIVATEAIEAVKLLKGDLPSIKIRFIYINALSYRGIGLVNHKLSKAKFDELFTKDKPILANFHGYPETLENILENYTERKRLRVHGFNEEGSTTTPFEMLRRNMASRYDLAIDIAKVAKRFDLVSKYEAILAQNHLHAITYGTDLV